MLLLESPAAVIVDPLSLPLPPPFAMELRATLVDCSCRDGDLVVWCSESGVRGRKPKML